MAQLNDTMVQGDLRVTGTMYGTQSATVVSNANLAVPPISTTSNTSTVGDYSVYYGANKYLPDSTNNYNVHTVVTNFGSSMYRATQIATASASGKPSLLYERSAVSSDGVAWTFGDWKGVSFTDHTHGNISSTGTLTDTAAASGTNDQVVIKDSENNKIQTSTIKGTDVADAVSKKHSHSTLTLSTTAQAYDGSHTLALPSTDPYTSARTPSSHTHGNITNGGALQTNDITIASGDKLVVTDSSDSSKVARASISFDGSTTTTALTPKGTFEAFAKSGDITSAIQALDVSSVGGDGKYISAISETDGKISATATTMDTTPTASSTKAVTSGGIKTALDGKQDALNVVLVSYNSSTVAEVATIVNGGKAPVCIRNNQLYVCDGINYGTTASPEYRFSNVQPNTATTPRIIYLSVTSSGWSSSPSIIQLALDSAKMKIDDSDNPDYDSLTASGIYRITSSASPTTTGKHSPESGRMTLIVINTDNFIAQMAMGYNIYFRYKAPSETFKEWETVVTSDSKVKIDVSGVVGTENDTLYFT